MGCQKKGWSIGFFHLAFSLPNVHPSGFAGTWHLQFQDFLETSSRPCPPLPDSRLALCFLASTGFLAPGIYRHDRLLASLCVLFALLQTLKRLSGLLEGNWWQHVSQWPCLS